MPSLPKRNHLSNLTPQNQSNQSKVIQILGCPILNEYAAADSFRVGSEPLSPRSCP
jgi:hypothetical protein